MNALQTRKLNRHQAEAAFFAEHSADFPVGTKAAAAVAQLNERLAQIVQLARVQTSQAPRQNRVIKNDALTRLKTLVQRINRAAVSMKHEIPGIAALFKMPLKRTETAWLVTAGAFHAASAQYESAFIDLDLPVTFRADLLALIGDVRQATDSVEVARGQRGGATGGLDAAFDACAKLSKQLGVIVSNKFASDPQKLAAWEIATHLDNGNARRPAPATVNAPAAASAA